MRGLRVLSGLVTSILIALLMPTASVAQSDGSVRATEPAAVTFTTLLTFDTATGEEPSNLTQGLDGNFFGTTYGTTTGGGRGFAFEISTQGDWSGFDFNCSTTGCIGIEPVGGMALAGDGNFYGVTFLGGDGKYKTTQRGGTVFQLNPQTGLNTLYSFCRLVVCHDGESPNDALTQGSDGKLYGTTALGGLYGLGTVFVMQTDGALTTLHSFNGTDGSWPLGRLIQATDGNFYGSTQNGGATGSGTVFRITPLGTLTTLHNFCQQTNCTDGYGPDGLIQAADGNLYGTTLFGGAIGMNNDQSGAAFKLTLNGKFAILYSFCSVAPLCADGDWPEGLVQASDGNFYGSTTLGGNYGTGTLFKLTPAGTLTKLHDFCALHPVLCPDGYYPDTPVQGTDGNLYGTTSVGGIQQWGTAFTVSLGLKPFVRTVTGAGVPGASVIILGTNLTGATAVTFNGMRAAYTVESRSEITATVPAGATTGPVVVATPGAVLRSLQNFRILP